MLCTCVFKGELSLLRRLLRAGAEADAGECCQGFAGVLHCGVARQCLSMSNVAHWVQRHKHTMKASDRSTQRRAEETASVCICITCAPLPCPCCTAGDYDGRTALHLAAAEGNLQAAQSLVTTGHANPAALRDRWGNTPLDEARRVGATAVTALLEEASTAAGGPPAAQV